MQLSDSVKRVLIENKVQIDLSKDYQPNDLIQLQDKIITFLNRKLKQAKLQDVPDDVCPVNIIERKLAVMDDIKTLTPIQLSETYGEQYFIDNHRDVNYATAILLCESAQQKNTNILQLWKDIIANNGNSGFIEGKI